MLLSKACVVEGRVCGLPVKHQVSLLLLLLLLFPDEVVEEIRDEFQDEVFLIKFIGGNPLTDDLYSLKCLFIR